MLAIELLVDGHHGVYTPQIFAEQYLGEGTEWCGFNEEDLSILLNGPDDERYWDAWDNVLNTASIVVNDHHFLLRVGENGDLFAVCQQLMSLQEQCDWCHDGFPHEFVVPEGHDLYEVGSQFVTALMYGDLTGLNDGEIRQYNWFVDTYGDAVTDSIEYDEFGECHLTDLRGPTALVVIKEKQA